jgi:hypothetical protein
MNLRFHLQYMGGSVHFVDLKLLKKRFFNPRRLLHEMRKKSTLRMEEMEISGAEFLNQRQVNVVMDHV